MAGGLIDGALHPILIYSLFVKKNSGVKSPNKLRNMRCVSRTKIALLTSLRLSPCISIAVLTVWYDVISSLILCIVTNQPKNKTEREGARELLVTHLR